MQTPTIQLSTGLVDGFIAKGAYPGFFGQPDSDGINHEHQDPEYAAEFGTSRVISSAARVAFDSAVRAGVLVVEDWVRDFSKFDIEVVDFNRTTGVISARFSYK